MLVYTSADVSSFILGLGKGYSVNYSDFWIVLAQYC